MLEELPIKLLRRRLRSKPSLEARSGLNLSKPCHQLVHKCLWRIGFLVAIDLFPFVSRQSCLFHLWQIPAAATEQEDSLIQIIVGPSWAALPGIIVAG